MAELHSNSLGQVTTVALDAPIQQVTQPLVLPKSALGQKEALKPHCPHSNVCLDDVGHAFGINFEINANPRDGFSVFMRDGAVAANELTTYQVMRGGYDGKNKLLTEFHRDHVAKLDDPFILVNMNKKEEAIEKIMGPIPEGIRPGTLHEWREMGWREEARKIIKRINAYNPVHKQVCFVTKEVKKIVVDETATGVAKAHEDTLLFREEEIFTVEVTPIQQLPKISYLSGILTMLEEAGKKIHVQN